MSIEEQENMNGSVLCLLHTVTELSLQSFNFPVYDSDLCLCDIFQSEYELTVG